MTDDALTRALEIQRERGGRLGEVLLELGMIRPNQLLRAVAEQYGLGFLDLESVDIDRTLAQRIPEPLARRHRALPVSSEGDTIVVAMANPNDVIALDDVRAILRQPVRAVLADPNQILNAIARSSRETSTSRRRSVLRWPMRARSRSIRISESSPPVPTTLRSSASSIW